MSIFERAAIVRRVRIFGLRQMEGCPACLHFLHGQTLEKYACDGN